MTKNTPQKGNQDENVFEGFEPANTTPVPDILFDRLLARLSSSELRVLLYIIRRTWGFKKDTDAISLNQFQHGITTKDGKVLDEGCGIKDRKTIVTTLASLEKKGYIQRVKSKTESGDDATTIYRIHFRKVVGKSNHLEQEGSGKIQPPRVVGKSNHGSGKIQPPVVGKSNPQETVLQETVLQERKNEEPKEKTNVSDGKESLTHSSTPSSFSHDQVTLSPEEQRIHSYWQELDFEDPITPKLKEHWGKLVKSVQSFEQFKSLYDHTKRSLKGAKDETVYPGNMVKCLTGWKQTQQDLAQPSQPKPPQRMSLAERNRMIEEKYGSVAGRK